MAYEWIPAIIVGIILTIVGLRLNIPGIGVLVRIALIIIGLSLLGWGIFAGADQITSSF